MKATIIKVVNIHTGKEYHVLEDEISDAIINLYVPYSFGMRLEKSVGNKIFNRDYVPMEKIEVVML